MIIRPDSSIPVFQQIVDGIRDALAAGVYRPGELVPSVRQQAIALVVNPNTVQRAYQELERLGLLVSRKGTGMVVAPRSQTAAQRGAHDSVSDAISQAIAIAHRAGLNRQSVDDIYRGCWRDVKGRRQRQPVSQE